MYASVDPNFATSAATAIAVKHLFACYNGEKAYINVE